MTPNLSDTQGGTNMDITSAGITASTGVASWVLFYLPFDIPVTRYRVQMDAGTATTLSFYCGVYRYASGLPLVFDIGQLSLAAGAGQYGPGAAHDPGTVFFDNSRAATSLVALTAGWYLLGWGASGTGVSVTPKTGGYDALWSETVGIDTTGLQFGLVSRGKIHSSTFNIASGHMPLTLGAASGGGGSEPPNICFFA